MRESLGSGSSKFQSYLFSSQFLVEAYIRQMLIHPIIQQYHRVETYTESICTLCTTHRLLLYVYFGWELIMQRDHLDLNEVPHFMLSLFILLLLCDFLMEKLSKETFRGVLSLLLLLLLPTSCEPDPHIIDFVNAHRTLTHQGKS